MDNVGIEAIENLISSSSSFYLKMETAVYGLRLVATGSTKS